MVSEHEKSKAVEENESSSGSNEEEESQESEGSPIVSPLCVEGNAESVCDVRPASE